MKLVNKNKGMTILEVIISMFIASIIIVISTTIFINLYKYKIEHDKEYSLELSTNNISLFIEGQIYNNELVYIDIVTIEDGVKALRYVYQGNLNETKYKIKDIYYINNRVIVDTYTYGYEPNTENRNVLSNNISEFEIIQKKNLIYIKVIDKFMQEEEICIVTRGMYY